MSILMEAAELTYSKMECEEYLKSDHWKQTRLIRRNMGVWRGKRIACEWCGGFQLYREQYLGFGVQWRTTIDIHHLSYENRGHEKFTDLMVLCCDCHRKIHRFIDEMVAKGHDWNYTLDRLRPYCLRRMWFVYQCYGHDVTLAKFIKRN